MSVELLSRVQFAFTVAFHYIFPPLSIGLGLMLVMMEAVWLKTRNPLYHNMARFWTKVFGLIFGLGVATGIVLEFEFGTNWATYSRFVGDIFGSALALASSLLALVTGHRSAEGVAANQPSKLAAMEGLWESGPRAPLHAFGWVDADNERTLGPKVPAGLSLLVGGKADHPVTGLDEIPPDLRPPLQATFQFFHLMVGIGFGLIYLLLLVLFLYLLNRKIQHGPEPLEESDALPESWLEKPRADT